MPPVEFEQVPQVCVYLVEASIELVEVTIHLIEALVHPRLQAVDPRVCPVHALIRPPDREQHGQRRKACSDITGCQLFTAPSQEAICLNTGSLRW